MSTKVLLTTLSIRTSARGTSYVTGWLGKSRLVGFPGEPDKHGNRTINLYVQEVEERREDRSANLVPVNGAESPRHLRSQTHADQT